MKIFNISILSITTLFFLACGEISVGKCDDPHSINSAISTDTEDDRATMAPSQQTLNAINRDIALLVKNNLQEENTKEANYFSAETQYCDVSGVKAFNYPETQNKIVQVKKFEHCKTTRTLQDGLVQITYKETNQEGKYAKVLNITVKNDYTFNGLLLKSSTTIESHIDYNSDHSISSISSITNGHLIYKYDKYELKNNQNKVTY